LNFFLGFKGISVEEGADTCHYLAASPVVAGVSGRYFVKRQAIKSSSASYNLEAAQRLWRVSEDMTATAWR
jgi:hypothetical protein